MELSRIIGYLYRILAVVVCFLSVEPLVGQIVRDESGKIRIGEPFDGGDYDIQLNGFNALSSILTIQLANYGKVVMDGNYGISFQEPNDLVNPDANKGMNDIRLSRIMNRNDYSHTFIEDVFDDDDDVKRFMIPRMSNVSSQDNAENGTTTFMNPKNEISLLIGAVQMATKRISEQSAKLAALETMLSNESNINILGEIENISISSERVMIDVDVRGENDNRILITDIFGNVVANKRVQGDTVEFMTGILQGKAHIATLICNGKIADTQKFVE